MVAPTSPYPTSYSQEELKDLVPSKDIFPSLLDKTGKPLTEAILEEGGEEAAELVAEEGVKSAVGQFAGPAASTFMAGKTLLDPKASGTDKALGGTGAALDIASAVPGPHQPFTLAASLGVKLFDMFA